MADTATAERPNKVSISDAGPCLKKVSIEIPAETVQEQLGTSVDTLITEAALPGFRKGHAPRRLVEKKFGSTIRREAKNQLVAQAFQKAVDDAKLRVVGDATSETLNSIELQEGKPLSFEIEVEVVPEFDLPELDNVEIKKPAIAVTDEMVEAEVKKLLLNEGRLEPKDSVGPGDYLTGHATMTVEGEPKPVLDIQDAVIQVPTADAGGKGMILGVVVEDFGSQIGTPAIGRKSTIRTTGPEQHENEAIRGKKLVITFEPKRADQIIPASIGEIAERYAMESTDQVKDAVRQRIEQRAQVEQQTAMRNQVARHLLDHTQMDLPKRLTAGQAARNLERNRLELLYRGVDAQKIEEKIAELRAASAAAAASELKLFFVLDRAAEKLDVKITDAELNGRIAQIAVSRGERPEKLRQDLINRNQLGTVYQQIREHKTMDAIIAKAKIDEVSIEEFNKLMGAKAEGGESKPAKPSAKKAEKADDESDKGDDKPKGKGKKKSE